jgi:hypothetical protein
LPATIDPRAAAAISDCRFRYGDPETAFAMASHRISITTEYPRADEVDRVRARKEPKGE